MKSKKITKRIPKYNLGVPMTSDGKYDYAAAARQQWSASLPGGITPELSNASPIVPPPTKVDNIGSIASGAAGAASGVGSVLSSFGGGDAEKFETKAGTVLSDAGSLASAGSAFGPIGTAVGAVAGTVTGLLKAKKAARQQINAKRVKAANENVAENNAITSGMQAEYNIENQNDNVVPGLNNGTPSFKSNPNNPDSVNAVVANGEVVMDGATGRLDVVPGVYNPNNPDVVPANLTEGSSVYSKNKSKAIPGGNSTPADIATKLKEMQDINDKILNSEAGKRRFSRLDKITAEINAKNIKKQADLLNKNMMIDSEFEAINNTQKYDDGTPSVNRDGSKLKKKTHYVTIEHDPEELRNYTFGKALNLKNSSGAYTIQPNDWAPSVNRERTYKAINQIESFVKDKPKGTYKVPIELDEEGVSYGSGNNTGYSDNNIIPATSNKPNSRTNLVPVEQPTTVNEIMSEKPLKQQNTASTSLDRFSGDNSMSSLLFSKPNEGIFNTSTDMRDYMTNGDLMKDPEQMSTSGSEMPKRLSPVYGKSTPIDPSKIKVDYNKLYNASKNLSNNKDGDADKEKKFEIGDLWAKLGSLGTGLASIAPIISGFNATPEVGKAIYENYINPIERYNISPELNESAKQRRIARYNNRLQNSGTGAGQAVGLAGYAAGMDQLSGIMSNAQTANANYRNQYASRYNQNQASVAAETRRVEDLNSRNRAAARNAKQRSLELLSNYAQNKQLMKNQKANDQFGMNVWSKYAGSVMPTDKLELMQMAKMLAN